MYFVIMKLLMHICCSNCCIYPLEIFHAKGIDVQGLWFNPNIHPFTEYAQRLHSLRELQNIWNFDIEYIDDYPLDHFLNSIVKTGTDRCVICYSLRLDRTASAAKKMNVRTFTTSLLASPYQKFDMIIKIGKEVGRKHGVTFYHDDFRSGWDISRNISREFRLYRQKYCGCIYSEMERHLGKKNDAKLETRKPKR